MTKGREESKLLAQINEDRNINGILKNNNLNVRKKKEYGSSQKMNVKQKAKQKDTSKFQKVTKQSSNSNMFLKCNKKAYKYQIQQLNLLFKQSLKYPMLTQDELYILFAKYKSDGHYRTNKDLPSFTSFFVDTQNMFDKKPCFYDQLPDMQKIKSTNDGETIENSYYNENQHVENILKQDVLKYAEIPPVNNMNSRIQNKCFYNDQIFPNNNNYNHLYMNHNIQHNDLNILNDIEHFAQSKLDTKKFSDTEDTRFSYNLVNSQDISEEYQNCSHVNKDLLYNISNTQCENLTNSENLQQNIIHHSMHNNFSLNSNFYDDCYLNRCSNNTSINNNSNYHSLNNAQSICTPQINNLESNFDMKNSVASQQLPLIKDHLEEQGNLNFPTHTDIYPMMNNKNLPHISNKDISNIQADFNAYSINSTMMSDDILSQTNAFIPLCAGIVNQYN
ncbi:hypothetical protein WN51_02967 [Melipona quadrifasciata]|uniref:Uncharacterized protein n=1 Tax=Melipona quadrifasciata TaxID=166423 RepID=A0A0M8ZZB0_9HYME|nr:hypothetical protein WN51_02967 [Melipona quadrifasciata]